MGRHVGEVLGVVDRGVGRLGGHGAARVQRRLLRQLPRRLLRHALEAHRSAACSAGVGVGLR